jgi:DNA mismatch repair protein PMS2
MAQIRAIDKASVARICSGQVITDLGTAVKELAENSIDAGAKHVEVKLKEFGLDLVEVSDSGAGIPPRDYEGLALKYHTSKLTGFEDLRNISSFGFRGEALSSLCELAGSFTVTTRTAEQSVGTRLTYNRAGKLISQETAPRPVGTTVSIVNLFSPLPVRQGEFRRNIKKQYNRLGTML